MGPPRGTGAPAAGTFDLATFNHWLCLTRVRAAGAIAAFSLALAWLEVGGVSVAPALGVCAGLLLTSWVGLAWRWLPRHPYIFFHGQTLVDLAAVTLGLHLATEGVTTMVFRPVFALIVVPASLISVPSGLAVAALASLGHELLLGLERGFSLATLVSLESLAPSFLFFLVAQQCFFYGAHLEQKNQALAGLATRLEDNRLRLAAEHRLSAALVDVARTLSSTLEAPELLARMNRTTSKRLRADWTATFLVDAAHATYRLAAVTDAPAHALGDVALPLRSFRPVERLLDEPILVVTGPDAARLPALVDGPALPTVVLAALYRDKVLIGFLAVGYHAIQDAELEPALDLLAGIAEHATLALGNVRLLDEVRQASAMKSEFVGAISHELRSPLNVMLGYLEMLLDGGCGPLTAEQRQVLERSQQYSLSLLEMITALLDLNRLEAGRLPVERTAVAPRALLEEMERQLPETWRRPEVAFRVDVSADLPAIATDAGKLKTVVRNLVHNALKFTDRGHVTVAAGMTPAGHLAITVDDTGHGIPPDALAYIFDMFRQVPGAGGGGVGLGLHLVQRLVQLLGGDVHVTSTVGRGTRFTITLPLGAPADTAEAA